MPHVVHLLGRLKFPFFEAQAQGIPEVFTPQRENRRAKGPVRKEVS